MATAVRRLKPVNDTATGVTVAQLIGGSRRVDIEIRQYDDSNDPDSRYTVLGKLPVKYNPAKVNGRLVREGTDAMARSVCRAVSWWDLADEDGPIPVGPDYIEDVADRTPTVVLSSVVIGLLEDQKLRPQRPIRSSDS